MKRNTKFYGYREVKETEDNRLARLKIAYGFKNNSQLFRFAIGKLEEVFLSKVSNILDCSDRDAKNKN